MSDDVDDLLRRTMATLDRQVPDGYFDTLVSRTLLRLDDPALGEPLDPQRAEPGELHEDAGPAASSPGWTAVALSEPAKPLAEPRLEVLDELARERAAREARAAGTRQAGVPAPATSTIDQAPAMAATASMASTSGQRVRANRRSIVAVIGLGLVAAAGATIVIVARDKTTSAPGPVVQAGGRVDAVTSGAPTGAGPRTPVEPAASGSDVAAFPPAPAAGSATPGDHVAAPEQPAGNAAEATPPVAPAVKQGGFVGKTKKPIATKGPGKAALTGESTKQKRLPEDTPELGKFGGSSPWTGKTVPRPVGKPSKQGVSAPNGAPPELDRSSLSSDDIKRGMTAVAGKAKACFAGTEGTATVQLTVAPSGRVQQVTVTGPFAGTPTGTCVEQAVRTATFPPWDGEPQNFGYDYLLSN